MATATHITGKTTTPAATPAPATPGTQRPPLAARVNAWLNAHRQVAYWLGAIVFVAAALFVVQLSGKRRTEEAASRELQGARFAYENQNLPFAQNELQKVIANYDGTHAAEEARLLLANVLLQRNQPDQAIGLLKDYAPSAGAGYRSQEFGLLGAAYENTGRFREAGEAYENGSAAGRLDFQKAQLLTDAGRAWTAAGDTARAVSAYRRVVKEFGKEAAATEAKVRLAELTKGAAS